MVKPAAFITLCILFGFASAFGQGPCSVQSGKLACVIPQEYGSTTTSLVDVLRPVGQHPEHFTDDIDRKLQPLEAEIGRQANLLPLASPSSGLVLKYDPSLKTLVTSTDSLGPILGERAETVGRHRLFIGFSYQYFNFDKIDGVNLHSFPAIFTHRDDSTDGPPGVTCSINGANNIGRCAFVRDLILTGNSIHLTVSQYTTYVTFGLTPRIDLSMVIPVENVHMDLFSSDTIVLGSDGFHAHLFKNCTNTTTPSADPNCLQHVFPDPAFTGSGSQPKNSASGIGDVVARVKWNAWEGERAGFAAGMDIRFPSGDALNYLGSGAYGFKPFAVFSYRARIAPHVTIGYEWNTDSITAGNVVTGARGSIPNDFYYSAGADAWVTKWLTGDFDIVGQRVFGSQAAKVTSQQFLAPCGACAANPTPNTISMNSLVAPSSSNFNYSITNASMGVKIRPLPKLSKLVFTANVLVRLDDGGLSAKPSPLFGLGYTF
jgi:hypothetical protein